jgi:hypothetical protein
MYPGAMAALKELIDDVRHGRWRFERSRFRSPIQIF